MCASGHPHITISTNSKLDAKPAEAIDLMQTMAATNAPSDDGSGGGGVRGEVGGVGAEGMAVYGVVGLQAVVVHPEIPSGDGGGNGDGSGGSGGRSVDPLLRLPKSIAKKLHEFMESADPGQRLKVSPDTPGLVGDGFRVMPYFRSSVTTGRYRPLTHSPILLPQLQFKPGELTPAERRGE